MEQALVYEDILLADDDADDVYFFGVTLNEIMVVATLRHAADGEKLFEELKKKIPDLLFLDIHMPCKNGVDCIREIRQNKMYDHMPVIMFSGVTLRSTVEQTFRHGANLFLEKPATVSQLAEKLKLVLSMDWKQQLIYPSLERFLI